MTTLNYSNAKIYKLEPLQEHEEHEIYIGSTCYKYLSESMRNYRSDYERYKRIDDYKKNKSNAFPLFDKYGIDNIQILLIENYSCTTKDELKTRQAYYIKSLPCMNKRIPGRTKEEYNQSPEINEKKKQYYEKNKETKKKHYSELIMCECGNEYRRDNLSRHKKTAIHTKRMVNHDNIDSNSSSSSCQDDDDEPGLIAYPY